PSLFLFETKRKDTNGNRNKLKNLPANGGTSSLVAKNSTVHEGKTKRNVKRVLPPEIISKIFRFLTPSELLTCARVCESWRVISDESTLWLNHLNNFPRCVRDSLLPDERKSGIFLWKREIIRRTVLHRDKKAMSLLKKARPFIGQLGSRVSSAMEKCFKFLSLKWRLEFIDKDGCSHAFHHDDMFYFTSSLTARWFNLQLPNISKLKSFSISASTAVFYHRDWTPQKNSARRQALLLSYRVKDLYLSRNNATSDTTLITLHTIQPGLMLAVWSDSWQNGGDLAWISICLPYFQLMEKILQATKESPHVPTPHKPIYDDLDSQYGLRRYSLTVELRNQRKIIWSNHYRELYRESFKDEGLVLHSGQDEEGVFDMHASLPWKTTLFKNILNDVVILDLTLMDEHERPLWVVSSAVKIKKVEETEVDYTDCGGVHSCVEYKDDRGLVGMKLIWMEDDGRTVVKDLKILLPKSVVNRWFGTSY
ncbi:F-box only protein 15-like, partial [Xenia sp. Carnegie-2017]|uniref:F-box only protein 15-like n=1 Tax=Xenia sp. Carnegie-2017 TaxID=2897299 RepID=UPI001F048258